MVYIYRTSAWYGLLPIEPMGMLDQLPVTYRAPPQLVYYYTPPQLAISDHFQGGMRTAWAWMKKFLWENAKSLTAWKFILLILVLCLFYGWESHFLKWYYKHVCWSGDKDGNSKRGSSIEKRKAEKGKVKWGNRHDFCLRYFRSWSAVWSLQILYVFCVSCEECLRSWWCYPQRRRATPLGLEVVGHSSADDGPVEWGEDTADGIEVAEMEEKWLHSAARVADGPLARVCAWREILPKANSILNEWSAWSSFIARDAIRDMYDMLLLISQTHGHC